MFVLFGYIYRQFWVMLYLAAAIWIFLLVRLLTAVTNLLTRQWLSNGSANPQAGVSILIPARNEAHNIGTLLQNIIDQDFAFLEVIVYDDLSTDDTAGIVRSLHKKDKRIRLVQGKGLPAGWLGKNHACHQLALEARGQYLLFLDADVRLEKSLLNDSLAHMQRHKLDLLSIFPQQIMKSLGEKISVPVMNWVLLSLLPLVLTRGSRMPAFAAANGQHMLFRGSVYRKFFFHKLFKNKAVEDIAIARFMKQKKLRIHTILSNGQIKCRMYGSLNEALQGFSKNVLAFFGNNIPIAVTIMLVTTFGVIPVYLAFGGRVLLVYFAGALLLRLLVACLSKQDIWQNIATAPLQQFIFCVMVVLAIHKRRKRKNTWKGRIIYI